VRNTATLRGYNGKYAFRNNEPLLAGKPHDAEDAATEEKRLGNIGLLAVASDVSALLPQR